MNKAEVLKRIEALETEAAALRKIIEAPEPVEKKPLVQAKNKWGHVMVHDRRGYRVSPDFLDSNGFETGEQAQAYAEAFNTMLDLRRQPGSEAAEDGERQWFIDADGDAVSWATQKTVLICPPFDSEASALAAREAVGLDRILRMYNTLHGRGY